MALLASLLLRHVSDVLYALLALVLLAIGVVSVALSRNVYRRALFAYAMRLNTAARRLRTAHGIFAKSMAAEEDVAQALRDAGWSHVYLRRRVAVARVGHNREIDVVAVGPVILVVEVKHWQGNVWSNGPRWFQQPNARYRHRVLEFEDVQDDNLVKAAALRRYLENTCRIALPDLAVNEHNNNNNNTSGDHDALRGTWYTDRALHKYCGQCVVPVVVFTNPRVRLDPATVRAKRHVYTMATFRAFAAAVIRDGGVADVDDDDNNDGEAGDGDATRRRNARITDTSRSRRRRDRSQTQQDEQAAPQQEQQQDYEQHMHAEASLSWARRLPTCVQRVLGVPRLSCHSSSSSSRHDDVAHASPRRRGRRVVLDDALQRTVAQAIHVLRTWDLVYLHDGRLITGDVQLLEAPSVGCVYARKQLLDMHIRGPRADAAGMAQLLLSNNPGHVELLLTAEEQYKQQQRQEQRQRQQQQQQHASTSAHAVLPYAVTCDADGRVVFPVAPLRRRIELTDRLTIKVAGASRLVTVPLIDVREVQFSLHHYAAEQQLLENA